MNSQRVLQLLTIATLVLAGVSVATNLLTEDLLPEQLLAWKETQIRGMGIGAMVVMLAMLAV